VRLSRARLLPRRRGQATRASRRWVDRTSERSAGCFAPSPPCRGQRRELEARAPCRA
jgi:hypothetical protein